MKRKLGAVLMLLGLVLLAGAMALLIQNTREQQEAASAVETVMPELVDVIRVRSEIPLPTQPERIDGEEVLPKDREMPTGRVLDHDYVGFLGIPALQKELPVMADWSYPQLKIAPCRFFGTTYADNLVIMAHNFPKHFGTLSQLSAGDQVTFTDMDGITTRYSVCAVDILDDDALEEMTAGEYDLTLFTCTYGGESRITVRCDRVRG